MLVKTKELNVAIKNAIHAICKDKNRTIFNNIHIFTNDNKLVIEAVDGFRLHKSQIEIQEDKQEFNILVKELKVVKDKSILSSVELVGDVLKINDDLYKINTEVDAKNFMDTNNVIPKYENENYIYVNPHYLYDALKDIFNESKDRVPPRVKLSFEIDAGGSGIGKFAPILLESGNQTNIVLPVRPK